jgi:hypothetical protein
MAGCVVTAYALLVLTKKYPYELTKDGGYEGESQYSRRAEVDAV